MNVIFNYVPIWKPSCIGFNLTPVQAKIHIFFFFVVVSRSWELISLLMTMNSACVQNKSICLKRRSLF